MTKKWRRQGCQLAIHLNRISLIFNEKFASKRLSLLKMSNAMSAVFHQLDYFSDISVIVKLNHRKGFGSDNVVPMLYQNKKSL